MKKILISLFTLIAVGLSVKAQKVSVADVEALPGETVSFAVSLSEGQADTYTAMTLYAQFPATGFTTTGAYTVSSSWTGATATVGDVDNTGLATIPFSSSNAIAGTEVDNLVTVSFTVASTVALGEYDVTLKKTLFEYGISDKVYAEDVTFKVNVVNRHTVVLDENSTIAPTASSGTVDVRVLRTINAAAWSTICLPFAMTEAQTKEVFGNDVRLAFFTGYDVEKEGENVKSITINFENDDLSEGFAENYPYLIKTSKDITEFALTTAITPDDVQETYSSGKGTSKKTGKFIGTYQANTVVPENSLFLSGNKFWYSTGLTKMMAYRAYFTLSDVLTNVSGASVKMLISIDGEEAGMESIHNSQFIIHNEEEVYDLSGRKMFNGLKKGVYLVKGKKVLK